MNLPKIAILIKIASLEFEKISNTILSSRNLTASQYRILKFLYSQQEKQTRIVDIERHCSITHPTTLGLLEVLEKKGFILKRINPEDARSKRISLTKKAKSMQSELERIGDQIDELFTVNLSGEEKRCLQKLLSKLQNLNATGSRNQRKKTFNAANIEK